MYKLFYVLLLVFYSNICTPSNLPHLCKLALLGYAIIANNAGNKSAYEELIKASDTCNEESTVKLLSGMTEYKGLIYLEEKKAINLIMEHFYANGVGCSAPPKPVRSKNKFASRSKRSGSDSYKKQHATM